MASVRVAPWSSSSRRYCDEAVADARDGDGEEATPLVHSLAEPGDRQLADDLLEAAVLHVGDE